MDSCVIFCAGEFDGLRQPLQPGDYIMAADGGLEHLKKLGIRPDGVIGDFDSLGYVPQGAQVFPVEKDDTDSMLAVRKGLDLGYRRFFLYGALDGPRLDHTLANLQTLCFLADRGAEGYLVGCRYIATAMQKEELCFPAFASGIFSLFCMGSTARGVNLEGVKYTLQEGQLDSSFPLGVSNHFTGSEAVLRVKEGTLVLLYDVENGFPKRERV